ncbi:protein of unknown function DUF541 [Candidatus Nitrososphaera gargensis Ga9.2]|uniref:Outer membrane protein n=1 Tax=Nitrososphaera gargensis (strain Ga9.2) TaxID=1237085 RepID=K0IK50_NITGG|nr:SIMPL domain-containing protein [Candidatus Nitrososphaera gargensis]AFU58662.1 protein of unknown function DUF541 [Candidatus Nitrososphaera gargensis Ga9.2]
MSSNQNVNKNTKIALFAGILAVGLLVAVLVGSFPLTSRGAAAQESGLQHPVLHNNTSIVSATGTATTSVKPDKVSIAVGVETNGTSAEEAASKNADLIAQIIAALKELGITEDQIGTSNYNVFPVYQHKEPAEVCIMIYPPPPKCQPGQEIVGYRAVNSITVTLDVDGEIDAGEVIDTAIEAGANNVNGIYFFLSDERQEEVRDSLIKEAIDSAKYRAEVAASALGYTISGVQSIHLNDVNFPIFYGRSALSESAVSSTPIMPGEQQVSTSVTVVFYMPDIAVAQ